MSRETIVHLSFRLLSVQAFHPSEQIPHSLEEVLKIHNISALYNTSLQEFLEVSLKFMFHPQNSFFAEKSY